MEKSKIEEILSFYQAGNYKTAEKEIIPLIEKSPNNLSLLNLLGGILVGQKKYEKAVKCLKKAIEINPNLSQFYYNLGYVFGELKKYDESIKNYNQAIKFKPNNVKAYNNLGTIFKVQNRFEEAINMYTKIIDIDINFEDAYKNLALIYCDIGKIDEAQKCFKKLFELKPNSNIHKINNYLLLTPIYKSLKEIDLCRKNFNNNLDKLKKIKYKTEQPGNEIEINFFYLAYHNRDNLELMKKLSNTFRKIIPNINYTAKNISNEKERKKIKIAFISEYFTDHTIGKLFNGLIKNIDRNKFDVTIFCTINCDKIKLKRELDINVKKIIYLKEKISEQQKQIENINLDIIFYPDIGMSGKTYFLSYARIAPVQIMSWGHPETSGISTIDYFLSSKLFEPDDKKKYSEKLIRLNQFPLYYEPPKNIKLKKKRKDFNLPEKANLYGCPQSLFKIHPDFDQILKEILLKDPNGYLIFIGGEGKEKFWSDILKTRWAKISPLFKERTMFLNKMSLSDFVSLCDCVDVLLDPIYFGGGNSFLESMIVGTPTVTMPNTYLKSNITAGAYKQMEILNPPIAKNSKEYVALAISLANSSNKNQILREEFRINANKYLFNNKTVLNEFENFLEGAHEVTLKGKKLKDSYIFKN